ncbi:MAG: GNAT family N-acetyltransferase [Clostridia bacterium]|nr:GNAT family N-acetyltransferase [Clostridia bacterium]
METNEVNAELKQLSVDMGKPEFEMLQDILNPENGFSNPAYGLSYDEYKEWLRKEDDVSRGINLPEGWIPATTYFLYIDGVPVGYGRVRHSSSEYLETVIGAGNLGYGISKRYRGKGYGSILFRELLKKCREIGYSEIKLFPMKSNDATIKIMLKNGGEITGDFKGVKHIIRIPLE